MVKEESILNPDRDVLALILDTFGWPHLFSDHHGSLSNVYE